MIQQAQPSATETFPWQTSGPRQEANKSASAGATDEQALSSGNQSIQVKIPAGTKLDIEAAYSVSSADVLPGELLSFRVLIPVKINNATVIDQGALVSGRVVKAKRGGHWGKSGKLVWTMEDVVAADGTRIPIQIDEPELANGDGQGSVKGTSHGGEVATRTVVMGALLAPLFPIAPLALMHGFKRGENAVLPKGKRLVVFVSKDTGVKVVQDSEPD